MLSHKLENSEHLLQQSTLVFMELQDIIEERRLKNESILPRSSTIFLQQHSLQPSVASTISAPSTTTTTIINNNTMKLSAAILALSAASVAAFAPPQKRNQQFTTATITTTSSSVVLHMGTPGMDMSGNSWKPDSEKMGSTDTGDYFPEGYNPEEEIAFSSGMMGSQAGLGGDDRGGPQLPGLENLGADAVVAGGYITDPNIPDGMEFIPSSVPDGEVGFTVASTSAGGTQEIAVKSPCMTFEDYYAAFSTESHPSLSVAPSTGRLDRRNGEPTYMQIKCEPNGQGGAFTGDLVINLPDDNSKICYKVTVNSM